MKTKDCVKRFKARMVRPAEFPELDTEIQRTREHLEKLQALQDLRYKVRLLERGEGDVSPVEVLINIVAKVCKLSVADIKGVARPQALADARFIICAMARRHTRLSLCRIGIDLGGKDHGSVRNGCRRASEIYGSDNSFRAKMDEVERIFLAGNK